MIEIKENKYHERRIIASLCPALLALKHLWNYAQKVIPGIDEPEVYRVLPEIKDNFSRPIKSDNILINLYKRHKNLPKLPLSRLKDWSVLFQWLLEHQDWKVSNNYKL